MVPAVKQASKVSGRVHKLVTTSVAQDQNVVNDIDTHTHTLVHAHVNHCTVSIVLVLEAREM